MPPVKPKRPRKSRAKGSMKSARHGKAPGKPAHVPTPEMQVAVNAMASQQIAHKIIAKVIDISPDTLRRHYADELDGGCNLSISAVMRAMFRKACDGDVNAGKFILERRGGPMWREPKDDAATATVNLTIQRASLAEPNEPSVTPVPDGHPAADAQGGES